ncbi:MAG: hypothetical protein FNP40_05705 [Dehalobacter sp. 4CP]|nr:hypothetical protein [Dehalobacter sp. 4CP]
MEIDRDRLINAILSPCGGLIEAGISEDMVFIAEGGLHFLITGEDGERLSDADLLTMSHNEDALAAMLFCDLKSSWQGLTHKEDKQDAWKVCDAIAAAFVKAVV